MKYVQFKMNFQKRDLIRFIIIAFGMGWCLSTVLSLGAPEKVITSSVLLILGLLLGVVIWHLCDPGGE